MEHAKHWEAPHPSPGTQPISEPRSSYGAANVPWSGYAVTSNQNNNDVYDNVSAQWIQPSVSADSNYPNSDYATAPCDAFWMGIGGQTGYRVVQAGVSSISTNTAQYRFWTEDYPYNPIYEGPVIVPGQAAFVTVTYNGNGTANYVLENASTDMYQSLNSAPYYDGSSAEFIVEKHVYPPRFSSESFSQAYVMYNNESGSTTLWAQNSTKDVMTDTNGDTQLYPGAINSNTDSFCENWVPSN